MSGGSIEALHWQTLYPGRTGRNNVFGPDPRTIGDGG